MTLCCQCYKPVNCLSSIVYICHLCQWFAGNLIDGDTFLKVINGLNETIGVVLEYLQDAKVTTSSIEVLSIAFLLGLPDNFKILCSNPTLIDAGSWSKERRWSASICTGCWMVYHSTWWILFYAFLSSLGSSWSEFVNRRHLALLTISLRFQL